MVVLHVISTLTVLQIHVSVDIAKPVINMLQTIVEVNTAMQTQTVSHKLASTTPAELATTMTMASTAT